MVVEEEEEEDGEPNAMTVLGHSSRNATTTAAAVAAATGLNKLRIFSKFAILNISHSSSSLFCSFCFSFPVNIIET